MVPWQLADLFLAGRGRKISHSYVPDFEIEDVTVAHFEDQPYVLENQFIRERYGIHAFDSPLVRSPREALLYLPSARSSNHNFW
jgi:hypothetical protein